MKYVRAMVTLTALAAILITAVPVSAAASQAGPAYTYTVQIGDTLYKISQKFGVSPDVILDLNNLRKRPDLLYAGEKITLPITMGFRPSYVNAFFYVVQTGDTVQSLNNQFYVDRFAVRQVNGLPADSNLLTPGATILIPAGPHHYQVQAGDTLQSIAAMFGQKGNDLLKANPQLGSALFLAPGTFVYIPIAMNAPYAPIGVAPAGTGVGGSGQGGGGFTATGNPATGLLPTDVVDAQAFNSGVTSAFQTISMPQNVVNLNQQLQIRWEQLRRVRRDSSRENGAVATFAVQFRGGTGTVTVKHWSVVNGGPSQVGLPVTGIYVNAGGAELWNDIEVDVPATCSASLQDQLVITSGITLEAHLSQWIDCPAQ